MSYLAPQLDYLHTVNRYRFLTILNAANACDEYQFSKQSCMLWLVNYPGDLYVQFRQAQTFQKLGKLSQSLQMLEGLVDKDPMFLEPYGSMIALTPSDENRILYEEIYQFLSKKIVSSQPTLGWILSLCEARQAFFDGNYDDAIALLHQALVNEPPTPIPAILHLRAVLKLENQAMFQNLSEIYFDKWPKCIQINIFKALAEMEQGQEAIAVERLHWAAAQDSAGQVVQQLLGSNHRFKNLWPDNLEIYFDLPVPASVSSYLGWNQLKSGRAESLEHKPSDQAFTNPTSKPEDITQAINVNNDYVDEKSFKHSDLEKSHPLDLVEGGEQNEKNDELKEIQKAFDHLAKRLKKPELERADNRFPIYVILSSKKQLETVYGPNTAAIIDDELKKLTNHIQKLQDWGALLFYPDDPAQISQLGIKPTLASDAWQVKLALSDLDSSLAKRGEMIGALLIVGGPEIVPFHHLPNPTFDNDLDVPSDNPYATIDENYFIPQWPVGRLPGESGSDAGLLLYQIRKLVYQYGQKSAKAKSGKLNLASIFQLIWTWITNFGRRVDNSKTLGYSAEIWREASESVYRSVGNINNLQLSPPVHSGTLSLNNHQGHKLGYFNLHGVKEGSYWYGQRDFSSQSAGPDYPIALSPSMFSENVPSPKLILTEACYGANIFDKQHKDALSLKCLDTGTTSFVGSTCIAYGSVTTPLIAADYLAESFWQQVLEGQPSGYALMRAKLSLAEEMIAKQGFLDGEDQKTLLSFILFGDPLDIHKDIKTLPKPLLRKTHPVMKTISDTDLEPAFESDQIPLNVNKQIKKVVKKYLPGLENAQMHYKKSGTTVDKKSLQSTLPKRYVVTLQKSFDQNGPTTHHHFARMTFDNKGKLVKFTTSR